MGEFLYWVVICGAGTGLIWYFTGHDGFIFMTAVSLLGGLLLIWEKKTHPHLETKPSQKAEVDAKK